MIRPHPYFEPRPHDTLDAPLRRAPIQHRRAPWWSRHGELMMWALAGLILVGYLATLIVLAVKL